MLHGSLILRLRREQIAVGFEGDRIDGCPIWRLRNSTSIQNSLFFDTEHNSADMPAHCEASRDFAIVPGPPISTTQSTPRPSVSPRAFSSQSGVSA
jgi:hypothetical protein